MTMAKFDALVTFGWLGWPRASHPSEAEALRRNHGHNYERALPASLNDSVPAESGRGV